MFRITDLRPVRHGGVDFHAAVHRARVHHDGIGLPAQALGREAIGLEVFLRPRA